MTASDGIAIGVSVMLVERPTGYDSRDLPLTVGKVYRVLDLDGSNVRIPSDDRDIGAVSVARTRVRAATEWERTDGGNWGRECDGMKFHLARVGRGWRGKVYFDGDECVTTCVNRDAGVIELYEIVREVRARREAEREAERNASSYEP